MTKIKTFLIITPLILFFPSIIFATPKINEAYTHPTTGQQEWIEIYFPHTDPITNVSGWSLWDTESSPSLLFTFEENTIFSPGEYFVISMINKLNNTGDTIVLKDDNSNFIDFFTYQGGESEKSWSLMQDESIQKTYPTKGNINLEQLISPAPTPIPTPTPTPIPTPTPNSSSHLQPAILNFMACPKIGSEWVQLQNPHDVTINLENYELWDSKNRFYKFTNEDVLTPGQFIMTNPSSNVLNNDGDAIELYSPNNELIEKVSYEDCDSLIPWEKDSDGIWFINSTTDTNTQSDIPTEIINTTTKTPTSGKILGESTYKPFVPTNLPDLKLETSPHVWSSAENVVFFETPLTIWGGLSVIIGGLLIGGSNLWNLYVKKQTAQLQKFP